MRWFVRSTMVAALALAAAGCGDPDPTGSSSAPPPTSVSSIPPTVDTAKPTTTLPDPGNEGGFGPPALAEGELDATQEVRIGGTLSLLPNGCWMLGNAGDSGLILFPPGTGFGTDPTELVLPDGSAVHDGDVVSGRGVVVFGIDRLPGGADGKWGNYASFCDEIAVAAATVLALRFEPSVDEAAQMVSGLDTDDLATDWGCGFGFVTSTVDERIALQLQWNGAEPLSAGDVVLPDPAWTANVVVGDFQFMNWCDDVIQFYEPFELTASNQAFEITAGTFTMPANDAATWCSGPVSVVVEGLVVDTPAGEVTFDPITIENDSFGCFAG